MGPAPGSVVAGGIVLNAANRYGDPLGLLLGVEAETGVGFSRRSDLLCLALELFGPSVEYRPADRSAPPPGGASFLFFPLTF